jgi:RimJ/RimL family protein N-acetyltransferase
MMKDVLSVREIEPADIEVLAQYWLSADLVFLSGMGVDVDKVPTRSQWIQMLSEQIKTPLEEKQSYCIIWQLDGRSIGHSNTRPIVFGEEAYMHLHLWDQTVRKKGLGVELVKMTLPYFFQNLQLKKLYCEPYALNPAPNRALQKVGFDFVKEYTTIPGPMNFEQPVKRWELSYDKFSFLIK